MSHLPNLSALSFATGVFPEAPNTREAARHRLLEEAGAPLELLELPDDLLFYIVSFSKGMSCDQIITNCLASKAFAAVCAQDVFWRWQSEKAGYDRQDRLDLINNVRVPKGGSWRSHYQWWCKRKHTDQTIRTALDELRPAQGLGWQYAHAFFGPMSQWDVSDVTDMSRLFERRGDDEHLFRGNIAQWDVSNVQTFSYMFAQQTAFNRDLSRWKVSSALNMAGMFVGCSAFDQSLASWGPEVSKVRDMSQMFKDGFATTLGLSNWDVSSVEQKDYMFASTAIQDDLSQWDVSSVENMDYMFFESLFYGDISSWEVGSVRSMKSMFMNNEGFDNNLSAWASRLGQVRDMNHMFSDTLGFTGIGLSEWDVSGVENMRGMFADAEDFNADLSKWYIGSSNSMNEILHNTPSYQPPPGHHIGMRSGPPAGPWPDECDGDGKVIYTGAQVMNAFLDAYDFRMRADGAARNVVRDMATDAGFHQILPVAAGSISRRSRKASRRFVHQHICRRAMLPGFGSTLPNGARYLAGMKTEDGSPRFYRQYDQYVRNRMLLLQELYFAFRHVNGGNLRNATLKQWQAAVKPREPREPPARG